MKFEKQIKKIKSIFSEQILKHHWSHKANEFEKHFTQEQYDHLFKLTSNQYDLICQQQQKQKQSATKKDQGKQARKDEDSINYIQFDLRHKISCGQRINASYYRDTIKKLDHHIQRTSSKKRRKESQLLRQILKEKFNTQCLKDNRKKQEQIEYFLQLDQIKERNDRFREQKQRELEKKQTQQWCKRKIYSQLHTFLKGQSTKYQEIYNISLEQLKQHLESTLECDGHFTWDQWSQYGFHIDHIKCSSSFDLTDEKQFYQCNHWSNLQLLWWEENLSKSNKSDWTSKLA